MHMIPTTIHYCWFGRGPMPPIASECIESWRRFLPNYEIKLWNEDNFDVNICQYTREAYDAKKFAFVSDYARFWILNKYGGLYFDTDVKLLKSLDDIIANGPFMGAEINGNENKIENVRVNPGVGMGANAQMPLLSDLLDYYNKLKFKSEADGELNLRTIVEYTTNYLHVRGNLPDVVTSPIECCGFNIYPKEYFSPRSLDGRVTMITDETRSIHLFTSTWSHKSPLQKLMLSLKSFAIKHILPAKYTLAKLEANRNDRERYFQQNFMIKE